MERGGSSNSLHKQHVNPRSTSGVVIRETGNNNNLGYNPEINNEAYRRGNDQYMPIANVIRIMRKILPPHAKIADDAKETVQECVSEFISFITSEANERCHREQRKTVNAEDVLWAMGKLGFDNYIEPLTLYLNRCRQNEIERTSVRGEPVVMRTVDFVQPPPQPQPQPPMTLPPVNYPQAFHHRGGMLSYYSNLLDGGHVGSSSSSSSSHDAYGLPGFDPNVHFK